MISLGWFLTQCEPGAGEQARLTHCQRGRKPKGLLPARLRIMSPQDMWHVCGILYVPVHVWTDSLRLCMALCACGVVIVCAHYSCVKLCIFNPLCNTVPRLLSCVSVHVYISNCMVYLPNSSWYWLQLPRGPVRIK